MEEIYNELIKYISKDRVLQNEPMSKHTTFKIGGPADIFVKVNSVQELKYVVNLSKENNIPLTVIGNGSNTVVKDKGIRGITVKLYLEEIKINDEQIEVGAGVLLSKIARVACENELSGLEFACGIPGTIGGAIKMNASAYDGEFKEIVMNTTYLDENGETHTVNNEEQKFSYRDSLFNQNDKYMILNSTLKLYKSNREEIL